MKSIKKIGMKLLRFNNLLLASLIVWCWYGFLTLPIYLGFEPGLSMTTAAVLVNSSTYACLFYTNYFFITPYFAKRQSYGQLILVLLAVSFSVLMLREFSDSFYYLGVLENGKPFPQMTNRIVVGTAFLMISIGFSALNQLSENQKQLFALEKTKLEAELLLLKTQINPHFLFNTLNNIYALAYLKDDMAAPMISKLSDMMRYMLYECNDMRVSLSKEVDFLRNYIDLQAVKAESTLVTDFYAENVAETDFIAPLILINFVENAFKHTHWDSHAYVNVHLEVTEDKTVIFEVNNSKNDALLSKKEHQGIGLDNTKKQLELNYPNRHSLEIKETAENYFVGLKIKLPNDL
jgi:sensor histidine kinase YesM